MTTDYPVDMTETFRVLGRGRSDLNEGIKKTVAWLHDSRGWGLPRETPATIQTP